MKLSKELKDKIDDYFDNISAEELQNISVNKYRFNIEELEKQFDELLSSFSDEDIKEWDRFDEAQIKVENMKYKITYQNNNFVQYKTLIPHNHFEDVIKPAQQKIADLESAQNKNNKETIQKQIKDLKRIIGQDWFTDKSPLYKAITTGEIKLLPHQGTHKVKVEKA